MGLLLIIGAAAALLLMMGGGGKTPTDIAGMSADEVKRAVLTALSTETDPHKLEEFANACAALNYADYANQLHARASAIRGGNAPPLPLPAPAPSAASPFPDMAHGTVHLLTVDEADKLINGFAAYVDASGPVESYKPGDNFFVIYQGDDDNKLVAAFSVLTEAPTADFAPAQIQSPNAMAGISGPLDTHAAYIPLDPGSWGDMPTPKQFLQGHGLLTPDTLAYLSAHGIA